MNIIVKLSDYENRLLDGEAGKLKQVAMQNIVRYAEILGAQSLCEVTKATVFAVPTTTWTPVNLKISMWSFPE
jgi:predicted aconitase